MPGSQKSTSTVEKNDKLTSKRGRPPGPTKVPFPVKIRPELFNTIRNNAGGNVSHFTEKVFTEYFKRNKIEIE